jgi:hypothetical protein
MSKDIQSVFHGKYGVAPDAIPCCPICDQPMQKGELLELQWCDQGPGQPDCARLVHYACENSDDDDEED